MKETRKAVDTTGMAKEFSNSNSISWNLTIAICIDGAAAMLVKKIQDSRFLSKIGMQT
jgi:hypothetical protein